jgi:hypothetical protein
VFAHCASFEPRIASVAHDRQQPYTAIATAKATDKTERAYTGILDRVRGLAFVAQQPACEVIGGVEMRQNRPLEA